MSTNEAEMKLRERIAMLDEWDEEMIVEQLDAALAAERSAGAAPLEVERLREAMHNENWCKNDWLHERIHDPDDDTFRTLEALAAEYARLSQETEL